MKSMSIVFLIMKSKIYKALRIIPLLFVVTLLTGCSFAEYFKKAILGNIPFVRTFVQKDFNTYTSITDIKDEMKLVTAKQQLDFINIMDGKDGRYLEISTYEVKAGIDCAKIKSSRNEEGNVVEELPPVEIFSSSKIHSVIARSEAEKSNVDFYDECIKPVNIAYEQKAKDYAVELGLLEKAADKAEKTLKNMTGRKLSVSVENYKQTVELPYLPLKLEIADGYLSENKMEIERLPENQFNRDSLVLRNTSNDNWSIRFGDSGRRYTGLFNDFYKNLYETNCNKKNFSCDLVEIFRYFDPMHPKESEVLSYSSDNYRTFFLLNRGRIYYIDAVYTDEQTLHDNIAPSMVYLASSIRKIQDKEVEHADEYENYIDKYFTVQEALRKNEDRMILDTDVKQLLAANTIRESGVEATADEKYAKAVSDAKYLGRTEDDKTVYLTDDNEFNEITRLTAQLFTSQKAFNTDVGREKAISTAINLDNRIQKNEYVKLALDQYLKTWFLQNSTRFSLSKRDIQKYSDELKNNSFIASRPTIARLSDSERNEYYYKLFRNRLSGSSKYIDTAATIDNVMKKSVRGDNMFVYFNMPKFSEVADGDIYERMEKINNNHDINNSFILVFNQKEFDFGVNAKVVADINLDIVDNDFHAIVLDDSTVRLFLNVGSMNLGETLAENIGEGLKSVGRFFYKYTYKEIVDATILKAGAAREAVLGENGAPAYFFYGDWKNLRVTPDNVTIAGHNFATRHITQTGKAAYRNTNDYAEKSVIAQVIDDLQHAYSSNDADFYYNVLCEKLQNQIQHYVYEKMFRPSPRMTIDTTKDAQHRYNH